MRKERRSAWSVCGELGRGTGSHIVGSSAGGRRTYALRRTHQSSLFLVALGCRSSRKGHGYRRNRWFERAIQTRAASMLMKGGGPSWTGVRARR